MKLLIASSNVHKLREFRDMFKKLEKFDLYSLHDFPSYKAPEENGVTFEENAVLKASHAAKALNMWVLADDSGLVVPSLDGRPGVFSSRFAGADSTDRDKRKKLLSEMKGLKEFERSAYFECVLSFASPERLVKSVKARVEGIIVEKEKGRSGFGYDPLFMKYDYDKTFGEIDDTTKNRISHRRKAFEKLTPTLESLAHSQKE